MVEPKHGFSQNAQITVRPEKGAVRKDRGAIGRRDGKAVEVLGGRIPHFIGCEVGHQNNGNPGLAIRIYVVQPGYIRSVLK